MLFCIFYFLLVVQQHYVVEVYDEFVIVGNTAVLRCHIPGFIKDFVEVVSWIQDSTTIIQTSDLPGNHKIHTFISYLTRLKKKQIYNDIVSESTLIY